MIGRARLVSEPPGKNLLAAGLILGRVEFRLAPLLLCVVVLLLNTELHDHLIHQLDHLRCLNEGEKTPLRVDTVLLV